MVKVTARRSLSVVDDGRRVTAKLGETFEVSKAKAERLFDRGWVDIVKVPKPRKRKTS